jgi:hypothetical protein
MSYSALSHRSAGYIVPSSEWNQMADNLAYLKALTDLLYLTVYNNDSVTLNGGAPVSFDPTYTSGLGVKGSVTAYDPRCIGTVKAGTTIASHASGLILAPWYVIQNVSVTGAVAFGHILVPSGTIQYYQDGGVAVTTGMVGFALQTNPSGTASISALLRPAMPSYYAAGTVVVRSPVNSAVASGTGTTAIASAISDGTNRLMLLFMFNNFSGSAGAFSAGSFTQFQNGGVGKQYFGALLAPALATANVTATVSSYAGVAALVFLNGVNQSTPTRTYADATGTGTAVSVTVACQPGDLVIAGFSVPNATCTVSARGAGQTNLGVAQGDGMTTVVDVAIATGTSITFTWTIPSATWDADAVPVISI